MFKFDEAGFITVFEEWRSRLFQSLFYFESASSIKLKTNMNVWYSENDDLFYNSLTNFDDSLISVMPGNSVKFEGKLSFVGDISPLILFSSIFCYVLVEEISKLRQDTAKSVFSEQLLKEFSQNLQTHKAFTGTLFYEAKKRLLNPEAYCSFFAEFNNNLQENHFKLEALFSWSELYVYLKNSFLVSCRTLGLSPYDEVYDAYSLVIKAASIASELDVEKDYRLLVKNCLKNRLNVFQIIFRENLSLCSAAFDWFWGALFTYLQVDEKWQESGYKSIADRFEVTNFTYVEPFCSIISDRQAKKPYDFFDKDGEKFLKLR